MPTTHTQYTSQIRCSDKDRCEEISRDVETNPAVICGIQSHSTCCVYLVEVVIKRSCVENEKQSSSLGSATIIRTQS